MAIGGQLQLGPTVHGGAHSAQCPAVDDDGSSKGPRLDALHGGGAAKHACVSIATESRLLIKFPLATRKFDGFHKPASQSR